MSRIRDDLTYADLGGRRRPRRYVLAAGVLLLLVGAIFVWTQLRQSRARAALRATGPLEGAAAAPPVSPGLTVHAAADSAVGEGAMLPLQAAAGTASCPLDPEAWAFLDVLPDSNYKRIQPDCVNASLARTVAWHMLVRMGYSKPEAAGLLGFLEIPWQPAQEITGLTATRGPLPIPLTVEWPAHPDYRYWAVDAKGNPTPVYSLRGCYRTRTVRGNRVENWNREYPALCVVALDYAAGWGINELGEHRYALDGTAQEGTRRFVLFGYAGEGRWVLVGEHKDLVVPLEDPERMEADREHMAAKYGARPWDAIWLDETFGMRTRSLPEGWETYTEPAEIQRIAEALNRFIDP